MLEAALLYEKPEVAERSGLADRISRVLHTNISELETPTIESAYTAQYAQGCKSKRRALASW